MDKQMTAREKAVLIERARNMVRSGGPHEWGYRDLADGTFVTDPFPFQAAQVLATMTPEPAQPAESPEARALSWIDVLREWFGGERYARDYEYLDANYRRQAEAVANYAALRAASTARPTERGPVEGLQARIAEVVEDDGGCWSPCSGCQEGEDGYVSTKDYPFSPVFQCQPGGGCRECGGIGVIWQDGAFLASYGDALEADDRLTGEDAWDILVNVDDRTSPEEYPDMCLITREELIDFMSRALALPATDQAAEVERKANAALAEVETFLARQGGFSAFAERARTGQATGWTRLRSVIWLAVRSALATQPATGRTMGGEDGLREALREARLQLEYMDQRSPSGTTPAVIARIDAALQNGGE